MEKPKSKIPKNIDEYIQSLPEGRQAILEKLRLTIQKAAPSATETISYGMPAFKGSSVFIWFAAAKNHYAIYPYPKTILVFKDKLKPYSISKGTIQFSYDEPLPIKLVIEIVKFRVQEDKKKRFSKTRRQRRKKQNDWQYNVIPVYRFL